MIEKLLFYMKETTMHVQNVVQMFLNVHSYSCLSTELTSCFRLISEDHNLCFQYIHRNEILWQFSQTVQGLLLSKLAVGNNDYTVAPYQMKHNDIRYAQTIIFRIQDQRHKTYTILDFLPFPKLPVPFV